VHVSTGTLPTARFPGQWFQTESGLHQNWMRDYDPTTGRYLEPDPLGLVDGASVYGYVSGNPMRRIDPTGLCAWDACIGETIAVGTIIQMIIEGAVVGAIVYDTATTEDIPIEDCCAAEREALRKAKKNNAGQCLPGDSIATLAYKIARLIELLIARIAAFECLNDGDPEHQRQIDDVRALVNECSRRLGTG
jgi:RHS repeat-associated protein